MLILALILVLILALILVLIPGLILAVIPVVSFSPVRPSDAAGKSQDEIDAAIKQYAASQAQMTQVELRAFSKVFLALEKEQQAKVGPFLFMMNGLFKNKNWDTNLASSN